jgi:hypothetical protein
MEMTRRDAAGAFGAALAVGLLLKPRDAAADCPNITKAITALTAVQGDLQKAATDFGGHKAAALKAVNEALSELGACLQSQQCK